MGYSMEYKKTISAGGIITKIANGKPRILLIRDLLHTDWVLPKGHVEDGETIEEAALREVREEAGLSNIHIDRLLGTYERLVEKTEELKTIIIAYNVDIFILLNCLQLVENSIRQVGNNFKYFRINSATD